MDHYRLLYPPHRDCACTTFAKKVIKCADPPIDETAKDLFSRLEHRYGRMFFSHHKLKALFQDPKVVQALLGCECSNCTSRRPGLLTAKTNEDTVWKEAWLLLAMMIYLGKLHFIHDWVNRPITDANLGDALGSGFLDAVIDDSLERKLFTGAYERAREIFNPVVFRIEDGGLYTRNTYPDHKRFPFLREELHERQGCFGQITKVEIAWHDLDQTIIAKMEQYPHAVVGLSQARRKVRLSRKLGNLARDSM